MRGRALLLAGALVACGPSAAEVRPGVFGEPSSGAKGVTSGSSVERYFPLIDGHLLHFVTTNDLGEQGMLVARVHRADATHGSLRMPSGEKRFEYVPQGVVQIRGGERVPVLLAPISVGNRWRGEHGGTTTIVAVETSVVVAAGRYQGCVETVEERTGDLPARYATTFCPDVGIVLLEVSSGMNQERAELRSAGAPFSIGAQGLHRVP